MESTILNTMKPSYEMKVPTVIMISGKIGSGKDTVGLIMKKIMEKERGCSVAITHFADPLKQILKKYYAWNGEKDSYGRFLLQSTGTDRVRLCDKDFWVRRTAEEIKISEGRLDYIIIPDARFRNEIEGMEEWFRCYSIRVLGNGRVRCERSAKCHVSETELDEYKFDYVVDNGGSFGELENNVREVTEKIMERDGRC